MNTKEAMTRTISPTEHLTEAMRDTMRLLERFPISGVSPGYVGGFDHELINEAYVTLHDALRDIERNQEFVDDWHRVAELERAADEWYEEHGWEAGPDPDLMGRGAAIMDAERWHGVDHEQAMERYKALLAVGYRPKPT